MARHRPLKRARTHARCLSPRDTHSPEQTDQRPQSPVHGFPAHVSTPHRTCARDSDPPSSATAPKRRRRKDRPQDRCAQGYRSTLLSRGPDSLPSHVQPRAFTLRQDFSTSNLTQGVGDPWWGAALCTAGCSAAALAPLSLAPPSQHAQTASRHCPAAPGANGPGSEPLLQGNRHRVEGHTTGMKDGRDT